MISNVNKKFINKFYSTQKIITSREALTKVSGMKLMKLDYFCHDYAEEKSNKPLLLTFHGMMGSKKNWFNVSKGIHEATGIKVIDVDARNHGGSEHSDETGYIHMAHDIKSLLDLLRISKVSVVGHSMGGRIAMTLALLWPELIHSLIVVDILPLKTNPQIFLMETIFDAITAAVFSPGMTMSEARKLADGHIKKVTKDINIRNFILDNLVETKTGTFMWRVNASVLRKGFQTDLATLPSSLSGLQYSKPTLFTAGGISGFISQSDMPEIHNFFPSAKVKYFEGAGHWLHTQQPKQFFDVLSKFLTKN